MGIAFRRASLLAGALDILPMALGSLLFGTALGLLAARAGLTAFEISFMSLTVFAGASQFVALGIWQEPAFFVALVLAVAAVNARHLLMGAALAPKLRGLPRSTIYPALFFTTDENWGMTMARARGGPVDLGYFLGGGLVLYLAWNAGTLIGHLFGVAIADPARFGLDLLPIGVFLALLMVLWRGRTSLLPWAAAAATALVLQALLPAGWPILLGALAGSLAGALGRHG